MQIALRQAMIEKINFELARLKRWKFGAKSEAMTAEQRQLFQDTIAADEASLQAQLAALQASLPETTKAPKAPPRKPRRQTLPEHLRRVEHRHEPEDTTWGCGQPMVRVGEDISERSGSRRASTGTPLRARLRSGGISRCSHHDAQDAYLQRERTGRTGELGYGIVLYANAALQAALAGMQKTLTVLRDEKEVQESCGLVTPFAERQRLVGKPQWDALEKCYS